ncbi:hypothetical protein OsJ_18825 [Oryza sativa Japonica Group]|uniref:Uncharacterized protein n=1 Tax=Oryza sativa subsp. japonica TaxID=39947 RepID=B9FJI3_ORYSJ|nr:hypothetical protein OsJ_18825 [Oryza sativa Japonica Group]
MASKHQLGQQEAMQEEDYIDMDLTSAAAATAPGEFEFDFHMSGPLGGGGARWEQEPLASPADELFYKGKLLPLHLPPRIQMVEELLDGRVVVGGPGRRQLAISTAPGNPVRLVHRVAGELVLRQRGAQRGGVLPGVRGQARRRRRGGVREEAVVAEAQVHEAAQPRPQAQGLQGLHQDDLRRQTGELRRRRRQGRHSWRDERNQRTLPWWPPPPQSMEEEPVRPDEKQQVHRLLTERRRPWFGRRREAQRARPRRPQEVFSSVIVRYSTSNKTSPGPQSSSCSSSSSVRTSSESDGGAAAPALRRSSSASSEVENPIQGLIAYCKRSQQLASVRKSASDAGFRFLSSAASKIAAAESDGPEELVEICRG